MNSPLHEALSAAILTLLRPLVRIMLRNGVAYGTFAELAKKTYVDVAFDEFAEPGKKQTTSRVSVLTGLTRKETKRLRELERPEDAGAAERYNRSIRVISGWLQDPEFLDGNGRPAALPMEGEGASFATLVRRYSGDMPTQAMLSVLSAVGSVDASDGSVRLLSNAYIPSQDPVDKLHILGSDVAELVATIDHNLTHERPDLRFQRKVSNDRVRPGALAVFRALSGDRAQALLEDLDRWLSLHEVEGEPETVDGGYARVSMGIYYYEEPHVPSESRS